MARLIVIDLDKESTMKALADFKGYASPNAVSNQYSRGLLKGRKITELNNLVLVQSEEAKEIEYDSPSEYYKGTIKVKNDNSFKPSELQLIQEALKFYKVANHSEPEEVEKAEKLSEKVNKYLDNK